MPCLSHCLGRYITTSTAATTHFDTILCSLPSSRAKQFRDLLARKHGVDSGLAMIIKQRAKANEIDRMDLVGSVTDSDVILGKSCCPAVWTVCTVWPY